MIRSDIRTAAKRKANDTSFDDTKLNDWLNEIEDEVGIRALWPYLEGEQTFATVSGTASYTPSTAFNSIKDAINESDNNKKLTRITYKDYLRLRHGSVSQAEGKPTYYAVWNGKVYLTDIPNSADTIRLYYIKTPANTSTDAGTPEIPARYHRSVIVQGLYAKILEFKSDPKAAIAKADYERGIQLMERELLAETADTPSIMRTTNRRRVRSFFGEG